MRYPVAMLNESNVTRLPRTLGCAVSDMYIGTDGDCDTTVAGTI